MVFVLFVAGWRRLYIFHVFAVCDFANMVWNAYGLPWGCTNDDDLQDWLHNKFDSLSKLELSYFITICWGIWEAIAIRKSGKILLHTNPRDVVKQSLSLLILETGEM